MSQFSGQEFTPIKIYEDNGIQISSLCSSETHVYLGTADGRIIMYEFRIENKGIVWKEIEETFIKKKAPIVKMAVWADKGLLITMSNNALQLWTPTDLQEKPGIPGLPEKIAALGFDQMSRSKLAVVSGKSVHIFGLNAGTWGLIKLVELPDKLAKNFNSLAFQGNLVGVALNTKYALVDVAKGTVNELMAFGSTPLICAGGIGDAGEELLFVQENKGLTIEKSGSQTRQKINWSNPPASVEVMRPYIISLQPNSIEVSNFFSVTKPVPIPISSYDSLLSLGQGAKHLLAFNSSEIFCLLPMPIEKQVEQLISLNRVHDALKIYMTSGGDHQTQEFKNNLRSFHEKAAIKFFETCNFDDAFKYFKLSDIKPRTVISFFEEYRVADWRIQCSDVREIIRKYNLEVKEASAKVVDTVAMPKVLNLLCSLLEFWSSNTYKTKNTEYKLDCDITLLKVYSDMEKFEQFSALLLDPSLKIPPGYASSFFERKQRPEPLSVVYAIEGQTERALEMFSAAIQGQLQFAFVDPAVQLVNILEGCTDWALVAQYSVLLSKSHPQLFRQIFINEKRPFNVLSNDTVLAFLKPYGIPIERDYLDFIINTCKSPNPTYHMLLANLLLQQILPLLQQINPETLLKLEMQYLGPNAQPLPPNLAFVPQNLFRARINLLKLLQSSPHYDPDAILKQIAPTYLSEEKIQVYKRLKMHEDALMIIIDVFNDCDRAEKYCIEDSALANAQPRTDSEWTADTKGNPMLFSYFNVCLKASKDEPYPSKACALLDKYPNEFDPVEVLKLLPATIPLHILKNFLTYSLKHKTHKMHHAQVLKNVTASQHMTYQLEKMELEQQKTYITYNTLCTVTGQPIRKMPFVRYPNGVLQLIPPNSEVQIDESICPKTGRDFNKKPVIGVLQ